MRSARDRTWLGFLLGGACALQAEAVRAQTTQDKHPPDRRWRGERSSSRHARSTDSTATPKGLAGRRSAAPIRLLLSRGRGDGDSGLVIDLSRFDAGRGPSRTARSSAQGQQRLGAATIEETIDPRHRDQRHRDRHRAARLERRSSRNVSASGGRQRRHRPGEGRAGRGRAAPRDSRRSSPTTPTQTGDDSDLRARIRDELRSRAGETGR